MGRSREEPRHESGCEDATAHDRKGLYRTSVVHGFLRLVIPKVFAKSLEHPA
jgi:hypothetical protein